MSKQTNSDSHRCIFHQDGTTVHFWNVYKQLWEKLPAELIPDEILSTLHECDRKSIIDSIAISRTVVNQNQDDDAIDQANDQFNKDYNAVEEEFSIFVHHFFSKHIEKFDASQLYEMCSEVINDTERQFR